MNITYYLINFINSILIILLLVITYLYNFQKAIITSFITIAIPMIPNYYYQYIQNSTTYLINYQFNFHNNLRKIYYINLEFNLDFLLSPIQNYKNFNFLGNFFIYFSCSYPIHYLESQNLDNYICLLNILSFLLFSKSLSIYYLYFTKVRKKNIINNIIFNYKLLRNH